ncbi:MAG TPA: aminoacyl-tRNA hydrolase [Candidatus Tyrphobacter sp.]|nr:aminoacyl-tRNA hydrolase [Candidatus Tyrphobacter sp.]
MDKKRLIVGLGNPGKKYESTYHNVGFLAVSALAGKSGLRLRRPGLRAKFQIASAGGFFLARPLTYMNESGQAVKAALAYLKLSPADLIVIHDEADLPAGRFKFASGGQSAGHKGIASVIHCLGTTDFSRLRIGVGQLQDPRLKAGDFVLRKIAPGDLEKINSAIDQAIGELESGSS